MYTKGVAQRWPESERSLAASLSDWERTKATPATEFVRELCDRRVTPTWRRSRLVRSTGAPAFTASGGGASERRGVRLDPYRATQDQPSRADPRVGWIFALAVDVYNLMLTTNVMAFAI